MEVGLLGHVFLFVMLLMSDVCCVAGDKQAHRVAARVDRRVLERVNDDNVVGREREAVEAGARSSNGGPVGRTLRTNDEEGQRRTVAARPPTLAASKRWAYEVGRGSNSTWEAAERS